jgi:hypothetical protein
VSFQLWTTVITLLLPFSISRLGWSRGSGASALGVGRHLADVAGDVVTMVKAVEKARHMKRNSTEHQSSNSVLAVV